MNTSSFPLIVIAVAGVLFSPAISAGGINTIQVTTTADAMDAFDQLCSLREAVHNARNNVQFSPVVNECAPGSASVTDVIELVGDSRYDLTIAGTGADQGDLDLTQGPELALDLRIVGIGPIPAEIRQTVAGQRVLEVNQNTIEFRNLIITGGNVNSVGGGIYNSGDLSLRRVGVIANTANSGGGLYNAGSLTIADSEIRFNNATDVNGGGGIYNENGNVVVEGSIVGNNTAAIAGGIANYGGDVTLQGVQMMLNQATAGDGGAVRNSSGYLTVGNSTFAGNSSTGGGGAISGGADGTIVRHSTFTGNEAAGGGGAISTGAIKIYASTFSGNSTGIQGGAINAIFPTIRRSVIENNEAAQGGGGIHVGNWGTLDQLRVVDNVSAVHGGGIYLGGGPGDPTRITRTEISGNTAANRGGGIYARDRNTIIGNTTITNNGANQGGGGLYIHEDASVWATNLTLLGHLNGQDLHKYGDLTLGNSIISTPGQPDCLMGLKNPEIISLGNNIADDDACFGLDEPGDMIDTNPGVEAFEFHGGSSRSWSLLPDSPARDSGSNALCAGADVEGVDQRGGVRPTGAACDIGAHEQGSTIDLIFADGFEILS